MCVTIGSDDFKHSIVDSEQRYVKCPSSEIKYKDVLLTLLLVHPIGNGCCSSRMEEISVARQEVEKGGVEGEGRKGHSRFIDDSHHL